MSASGKPRTLGDGDTRTFDWTPSAGQDGNYNVTFTLDDCGTLADTRKKTGSAAPASTSPWTAAFELQP